jgi:hypothetical protein
MALSKQMEMFEDGGLKDEGGMIDEESGNDVPIGSTREEVRDDIPAQLSEGEFVFPADVVRFVGLEKLMQMRQKAKEGLKKMEDMGQMGNSEEATIPDDVPFSMDDLDMEDDKEEEVSDSNFNRGGVVKMAEGGTTPTTENTDLNATTINESNLNPKQQDVPTRTATSAAPTSTFANKIPKTTFANTSTNLIATQPTLNVKQEAVPMRTGAENLTKGKDFLNAPTYDLNSSTFKDSIPSNIGYRFTETFDEAAKRSAVNKLSEDFDEMGLTYNPSQQSSGDGGNSNTDSPTPGTVGGNVDYSATDVLGLDESLRGAYKDFTQAQLDMTFGIATSNVFSLALSGISTAMGKGMGPVANAEIGKAMATAFNSVVADVQRSRGLLSNSVISSWGKDVQQEIAEKGKLAMELSHDIVADRLGMKSMFSKNYGYTLSEKATAKAKGLLDSILGKEIEPSVKQAAYKSFNSFVTEVANQSLEAKANQIDDEKAFSGVTDAEEAAAQQANIDAIDDENAFSGQYSMDQLSAMGFSQAARDSIAAMNTGVDQNSLGATATIGLNTNNQPYSINPNGSFTYSNGVTTNVTDRYGNPINAPALGGASSGTTSGGEYGLDPDTPSYGSVTAFGNAMAASSNSGYYGTLGNAITDAKNGNKKAQKQLSILGIDMNNPNNKAGVTTPNDPDAGGFGVDPSPDPYGGTDPMGNPTGVTGPPSNTNTGYSNQGPPDGPDGEGGGDDGSHICTATYNTGHINKEHFTTLKKYGILLRRTDPYMMKAYDVFGPKVASLVNSNKYVTSFAKFITQYYKDTMDNKPLSIKQKLFNILSVTILRPMWRLIGRFV